ncbi:hypothetical protein D3C76_914680 [compost metagenome]
MLLAEIERLHGCQQVTHAHFPVAAVTLLAIERVVQLAVTQFGEFVPQRGRLLKPHHLIAVRRCPLPQPGVEHIQLIEKQQGKTVASRLRQCLHAQARLPSPTQRIGIAEKLLQIRASGRAYCAIGGLSIELPVQCADHLADLVQALWSKVQGECFLGDTRAQDQCLDRRLLTRLFTALLQHSQGTKSSDRHRQRHQQHQAKTQRQLGPHR